jgi:hypothetical protein
MEANPSPGLPRPMTELDLEIIRLTCRALAAETMLEFIAGVIGNSAKAEGHGVADQLIRILQSPLAEMQDLTLPSLDAPKSDLLASEYREAHQALLARVTPLLRGE